MFVTRFRTAPAASTLLLATCALGAVACGGAESGPIVQGRIVTATSRQALTEASVPEKEDATAGSLAVEVNGQDHPVILDSDGSFTMDRLPTGDLTMAFKAGQVEGSVTVRDAYAGERIELAISLTAEGVTIKLVRRDPPVEMTPPANAQAIELRQNHTVLRLGPGTYKGDLIVSGNHVVVLGPGVCGGPGAAVLEGRLIVRGNHARVFGVAAEGSISVTGKHAYVDAACGQTISADDD